MEQAYRWFKDFMGGSGLPINSSDKFFFWFLVVLSLGLIFLLCMLTMSIIDEATAIKQQCTGTIIDKKYDQSTQSSGIGVGMTSGGQTAVVATSSGTSEKWFVIVRDDLTKEIVKLECKMQFVYDSVVGQKVRFIKKIGGISKDVLSNKIAE